MKFYCLHPGWVTSATDFDEHFIDASKLADLYNVNKSDCGIFGPVKHDGEVCLYQSSTGSYTCKPLSETYIRLRHWRRQL